MAAKKTNTIEKFLKILRYEKQEITSIYIYSILAGLVQLSLPLGIQSIISFVMGGAISTSMVLLVAVVIIGVFAGGLLQVKQMKIIERIQQQLFVRYAFRYTTIIPSVDAKILHKKYLPEVVNRFFDTVLLQKSMAKILLDVPAASIQILFGLILLSFYHAVFIFFGILLLVVLFLILRSTGDRGLQTSIQESNYKYSVVGHIQDIAKSVLAFKFSHNKSYPPRMTDKLVTGYLKARTSHFRILLFQYWTLISFKVLIVAAMLIIGGFLLVNQKLNIGEFVAAEIVIISVIGSVEKLIVNLDKVYDVLTSVEKISKVLELPTESSGGQTMPNMTEAMEVSLSNVNLSFGPEVKILKEVSITFNKDEKVCITGPDKAAVSALLKVVGSTYRFYEGAVLFNGIPADNFETDSLRSNIGIFVSSQSLFEGTLIDNIRVGDNSIGYDYINEIAALVGLSALVRSHREGYDMHIVSSGQNIAAEDAKRILLVRALVHQPRLLVLENPFTELNAADTDRLRQHLLSLKNTTVVIATDDSAYAAQADKVFKMENGILSPGA